MARFDDAIEQVLKHEGGYVNDPDDPGGETNFGISKRAHPKEDIRSMTKERAKAIYKSDYWMPLWDEIRSQPIASCLFDFAVNAGTLRAISLLQRALNRVIAGPVIVDGVFGQNTLAAVNAANQNELLRKFILERVHYYTSLNRPKFIRGWVSRAMEYWE